jgi:signal transduction histidine kinase
VSRDIVRELGGGIEVTSSRGRGTAFRVTLPGVS